MKPGVVPIPLLPLLALVHGVEEVRAGAPDGCVPDRPKVRNRQRLLGRLGKEEVADRRMRRPCELLKLLQRRLLRPVLPLFERREASEELLRGCRERSRAQVSIAGRTGTRMLISQRSVPARGSRLRPRKERGPCKAQADDTGRHRRCPASVAAAAVEALGAAGPRSARAQGLSPRPKELDRAAKLAIHLLAAMESDHHARFQQQRAAPLPDAHL